MVDDSWSGDPNRTPGGRHAFVVADEPLACAPSPVHWRLHPNGQISSISANVQEYLGFTPDEVHGRFADSFIAYVDRQRATEIMFGSVSAGRGWAEVFVYIAKGGQLVPMTSCGAAVIDAAGTFVGFEGTMHPLESDDH